MKIAKLVGGGLLAYALAVACGGMSPHAGGSNTNWFETCNSTADCGSGLVCWCGVCTATCPTDCDVRAGASCNAPPVSCTDEAKSACAVGCQRDADCSALGASASCVDAICRKAPGDGGKLSCDQRTAQIVARLSPLEDGVDKSCTTTADCIEFPRLSCEGGCPTALASKTGGATLAPQFSALEKELCDPFSAAGCTVLQPPCVFPGNPACVAGRCQRVLPGAPDSGTTTCDSIANQIVDRLTTATESADDRCTKDADCTHAGPGASCLPDCPYKPVSKAGAASVAAERAAVERDLCPQLDAQGCSPPIYTCPAMPVQREFCETGTGHCTDVPATLVDGGFTCANRTADFRDLFETSARKVSKTCAKDEDCSVTMLANRCYESCTYAAASADGTRSLQQILTQEEMLSCGPFEEAGCKVTRLPCVAPPVATCQAGTCTL